MKFFVTFVALVAVAVAFPNKPAVNLESELEAIIAAIHSPSTDPATAALLEQQLEAILGGGPVVPQPIAVGPAPVDHYPISIGPAIVDFPLPDGGAVSAPCDLVPSPSPSPVVVGPIAPGSPAPLVQLIVNVNAGAGIGGAIAEVEKPQPVIIVDEADNSVPAPGAPVPIDPVDVVDITPVVVVDPVQVVDVAPIAIEPVQVGSPVFPSPAINLPDELN
ncbi:translation initiation factor IF-2 [Manduca sexta]|uniref:Cuticle protein n=1 Tax=Manduca sexta TaxID=7130 RepID=A0A921ZIN5_MANSE|nr:translation initiation factor IF-2 [Manduca sexta]KAG6458476.1 hypothetical protein O3G_MSEX010884 [Manduca sexta]